MAEGDVPNNPLQENYGTIGDTVDILPRRPEFDPQPSRSGRKVLDARRRLRGVQAQIVDSWKCFWHGIFHRVLCKPVHSLSFQICSVHFGKVMFDERAIAGTILVFAPVLVINTTDEGSVWGVWKEDEKRHFWWFRVCWRLPQSWERNVHSCHSKTDSQHPNTLPVSEHKYWGKEGEKKHRFHNKHNRPMISQKCKAEMRLVRDCRHLSFPWGVSQWKDNQPVLHLWSPSRDWKNDTRCSKQRGDRDEDCSDGSTRRRWWKTIKNVVSFGRFCRDCSRKLPRSLERHSEELINNPHNSKLRTTV